MKLWEAGRDGKSPFFSKILQLKERKICLAGDGRGKYKGENLEGRYEKHLVLRPKQFYIQAEDGGERQKCKIWGKQSTRVWGFWRGKFSWGLIPNQYFVLWSNYKFKIHFVIKILLSKPVFFHGICTQNNKKWKYMGYIVFLLWLLTQTSSLFLWWRAGNRWPEDLVKHFPLCLTRLFLPG